MQERSAYIGSDGELLIKESVVLVIDQLGSGMWMRGDFDSAALAERSNLLHNAREFLGGHPSRNSILSYTDNVVLAERIRQPDEPREIGLAITSAAWYQLTLALQGVLTRGGIAVGLHHGSAEIVAGPALMDAHEIEQNLAVYPRIVLSERALETVRRDGKNYGAGLNNSPYNEQLVANADGLVFVSYLSAVSEIDDDISPDDVLERHRRLIAENLGKVSHSERARTKWVWAAGYHNWFITRMDRPASLLASEVPALRLSFFAGEPTYTDLAIPPMPAESDAEA